VLVQLHALRVFIRSLAMRCLAFFPVLPPATTLQARSCTDPLGGAWDGNATTGTATLRRDGFASLTPAATVHAGAVPEGDVAVVGVVTTEPLVFAGAHLFVNVNASAPTATLAIKLIDPSGAVVKTSRGIRLVDSTRLAVQWQNNSDANTSPPPPLAAGGGRSDDGATAFALHHAQALAEWGGGGVRLRFELDGPVHLYSFWFSNDARCGASGGPVAGGGRGFVSNRDTEGGCSN
jgi:hypothetical protein